MIYLDNAATTRVCRASASAVLSAMRRNFGNPSSLHGLGLEAETLVKDCADKIASIIGAQEKEIIFTSGATESNNMAFFGVARAASRTKRKIVISAAEHPSVYEAAKALEKEGFEIVEIFPRSDGILYAQDFLSAADENTALISCMLVNNETGSIFPVEEISKIIKKKYPQILIHTDAVQAFGKIPVNVNRLSVDLMSISAHKIYGPKGVGALYIRKGSKIRPLLFGGGQQRSLRPGTESVPLIAGFAAAACYTVSRMDENQARFLALKEHLAKRLEEKDEIRLNNFENSVPYIASFSVKGIKSEVLLHFLEERGIYVSSGSACSRGKKSRVLSVFGLSPETADTTVRISFSPENTEKDIDTLIERVEEASSTLAKIK